jgi:hypothetical protein
MAEPTTFNSDYFRKSVSVGSTVLKNRAIRHKKGISTYCGVSIFPPNS